MAQMKQVKQIFSRIVDEFEADMTLTKAVGSCNLAPADEERGRSEFWRNQQVMASSYEGTDMTGKFNDVDMLSIRTKVDNSRSNPFALTANQLNDPHYIEQELRAAKTRLASDINTSIAQKVSTHGTAVVSVKADASGFNDVALADAIFNETGIAFSDRKLFLNTRDSNKMSADLAIRQTVAGKTLTAYEKAALGEVAGFDTFKLREIQTVTGSTAAATVVGADQSHDIKPYDTVTDLNIDNRYGKLKTSGGLVAGDAFTIEGVNSVNLISKQDTAQLKTFRVISVDPADANTVVISPAIVSADLATSTSASKAYQNVTATPADGAAINILNAKTSPTNLFWQGDAVEIIPARYGKTGKSDHLLSYTSESGVVLQLTEAYDINTKNYKFRLDCRYGVDVTVPEATGIMIFNQA